MNQILVGVPMTEDPKEIEIVVKVCKKCRKITDDWSKCHICKECNSNQFEFEIILEPESVESSIVD